MPPKPKPVASRFWSKVNKDGDCWLWTAVTNHHGYGMFNAGTDGPIVRAHRWSWEAENGPIPEGLVIDHLCRIRTCVRPSHLRVVTNRENVLAGDTFAARKAAQTHCVHGHSLEGAYITKKNQRKCRTCVSIAGRKRWLERKLADGNAGAD